MTMFLVHHVAVVTCRTAGLSDNIPVHVFLFVADLASMESCERELINCLRPDDVIV